MKVLFPTTLDEACAMLAEAEGKVTPMAGGTDLLVEWPLHPEARDETYLDLSGIGELRSIRWTDADLILGAGTTYWDVIQDQDVASVFPMLVSAAWQVGSIQIQTRGTWAGNIINASPAADGVAVLMAYDAVVVLQDVSETEKVPLSEFYQGYKVTRRRPEQLVKEIRIPQRKHLFEVFEKVGARRAQAITKVGVAVAQSGMGWRVVANSVAPVVCRCRAIETMLEERRSVSSPDGFLSAVEEDVSPIDDIRSTAEYRKRVMARLLYYDLREVCDWIE